MTPMVRLRGLKHGRHWLWACRDVSEVWSGRGKARCLLDDEVECVAIACAHAVAGIRHGVIVAGT